MKVAILGWGSEVKNENMEILNSSAHLHKWKEKGPNLPIELTHVTDKHKLIFALDENTDYMTPVYHKKYPGISIREAINKLKSTKGIKEDSIGWINEENGNSSVFKYDKQLDITEILLNWIKDKKYNAVVWSALLPRFWRNFYIDFPDRDKLRENIRPSPEQAIEYLQLLRNYNMELLAKRYIENIPKRMETYYTNKIRFELGWRCKNDPTLF